MEPKKQGVIERTTSYLMAVPKNEEDIETPETVIERLQQTDAFEVVEIGFDEESEDPVVTVVYHENTYEIHFFAEEFELSDLYAINHRFSEENFERMKHAKAGLTTAMTFGDDAQESYHLQLKVLACMIPDMAGVVDFCSERILSPVWAHMAAESAVAPSPLYLFSIQAVGGEDDKVWLHTHGLNRCGIIELEVIGISQERYQDFATIINTMASHAICVGEIEDEEDAVFVAALPDGGALVCTWIDWQRACERYPSDMTGGLEDRDEGHNEDIGTIFCYLAKEDFHQRHYVPLTELKEECFENPLFMVTNEETERMSALARERITFLRAGLNIPEAKALVKMRLPVDADKVEAAGTDGEHIWFSVDKIDDAFIYGELTQQPYYVSNMHPGSKAKMEYADLTDWVIHAGKTSITPDSAYLLIWE